MHNFWKIGSLKLLAVAVATFVLCDSSHAGGSSYPDKYHAAFEQMVQRAMFKYLYGKAFYPPFDETHCDGFSIEKKQEYYANLSIVKGSKKLFDDLIMNDKQCNTLNFNEQFCDDKIFCIKNLISWHSSIELKEVISSIKFLELEKKTNYTNLSLSSKAKKYILHSNKYTHRGDKDSQIDFWKEMDVSKISVISQGKRSDSNNIYGYPERWIIVEFQFKNLGQ